MNKWKNGLTVISCCLGVLTGWAQTNGQMKDYLGVGGTVAFNSQSYNLSWAAHPSANYYKHEYIPKGEVSDHFKSMIMIEVVTDNAALKDAVDAKIEELRKMKDTNPLIDFQRFDNPKTGEFMLDFLITANSPQGKINIAERNIYRYKSITDTKGRKGILLVGFSSRSYGNDAAAFIASFKSNRKVMVNQLAQLTIPAIKL